MTRRLLLAVGGGGSFTLPPRPDGVITVGSITTITDDSKYNAWPVICRLADDSLLLAYTKGDSHHGDNTGKGVGRISADDGATWGSEFDIYDHGSLWVSVYGVFQTSSGRIIASLWRDNYASDSGAEAGIVYSDDNGATWSSWVAVSHSFTKNAYAPASAIQIDDGDLLLVVEGNNSGQTALQNSAHTVRSADDGATWGSEVTVRDYATDTRPYYESKLVKLASGDLLCVHRCSANAGLPHYTSRSTDDGLTWGSPISAFAGFAAPATIQLSNGVLIVATRKDDDFSVIAYTSLDEGSTWSGGTVVDDTMYEMEYACPVQLLDGAVLLVYGSQQTSSTSNSDIKAAILTVT